MPDARPSRTKDRAYDVLASRLDPVKERMTNDRAKAVLCAELLTEVFDLAWKHQFDDDRSDFINRLKALVDIAVEANEIGD